MFSMRTRLRERAIFLPTALVLWADLMPLDYPFVIERPTKIARLSEQSNQETLAGSDILGLEECFLKGAPGYLSQLYASNMQGR